MTFATGHFQMTRSFSVTVDRLWHLLTDPEARASWSAPSDEDELHLDLADLREDGREVHRCGPAEAPAYTVVTRWYRLAAPEGACFTETVEAEGMRIATSLVTCQLTADGDGARLALDVAVSSFVGEEALGDFEAGWTSALGRLERQV